MPQILRLPKIASMWIGDPLSYIELVVIQSFLDNGHDFTLYTLDDVGPVPKGVTIADPREIYEPTFEVGPGMRHNNAVYADIFRLLMIRDTGAIWADVDAYCVKPFLFPSQYVFGLEDEDNIATGVLGFPQDSPALANSIAFATMDNPIPPYFTKRRQDRLAEVRNKGGSFELKDFSWGVSGPRLVSHFLKETGESKHAQGKRVFYPGPRAYRKPLLTAETPIGNLETRTTVSVHIYGKTKTFLKQDFGGLPPAGSYIDTICKRHGIDPNSAPI